MVRTTIPLTAAAVIAGSVHADITDFSSLQHGQIIQASTFADIGMLIEATNFQLPGAMPMAFDTTFINTADPDLQGPPWEGGNLPANTILGNVVIIPENLTDANNDGIVDSPDDEGARPAGDLTFRFADPIASFGFDVVDIEGVVQELTSIDFMFDGQIVGSLNFDDFGDDQSIFYDPTIAFGNNSLNRVQPVFASDFGAEGFNSVVIHLGGSGAFDNIVTTPVPSPAGAAVLAIAGLATASRRRH